MFNSIKCQIANHYAEKARNELVRKDIEAIINGLLYLKKTTYIVPSSSELVSLIATFRKELETYQNK